MKEDIRQAAAEEAALLSGATRFDISQVDKDEKENGSSESTRDYNKKEEMPNPEEDEIWKKIDFKVNNLKQKGKHGNAQEGHR